MRPCIYREMAKTRRPAGKATDPAAVGERIREARKDLELSGEKLADLAKMSRNHLYVLERGEAAPTLATLGRLAAVLDVSRDWLEGVAGSVKKGEARRNGRRK